MWRIELHALTNAPRGEFRPARRCAARQSAAQLRPAIRLPIASSSAGACPNRITTASARGIAPASRRSVATGSGRIAPASRRSVTPASGCAAGTAARASTLAACASGYRGRRRRARRRGRIRNARSALARSVVAERTVVGERIRWAESRRAVALLRDVAHERRHAARLRRQRGRACAAKCTEPFVPKHTEGPHANPGGTFDWP